VSGRRLSRFTGTLPRQSESSLAFSSTNWVRPWCRTTRLARVISSSAETRSASAASSKRCAYVESVTSASGRSSPTRGGFSSSEQRLGLVEGGQPERALAEAEPLADRLQAAGDTLFIGGKRVQAGGDQRLHRVGHLLHQLPAIGEQAHELLRVERVAAGALEQGPLRLRGGRRARAGPRSGGRSPRPRAGRG
jgi:hypothetical protein